MKKARKFRNFTVLESLFIKVAGLACKFIKIQTSTQFSFCEYCKTFKNTYFEELLPAAAFDSFRKNTYNQN